MDPLVGSSPLRLTNRRRTDTAFTIAFLATGGVCFILVVTAFINSDFSLVLQGPPQGCAPSMTAGGRLLQQLGATASPGTMSIVLSHWFYLLPLVLMLCLVGLAMVHAIRSFASTFVYAAMWYIPASLVVSAVAIFGGGGSGVWATLALVSAALWCALIVCMRHGLRLTAALLEQAATVLVTHPDILHVSARPRSHAHKPHARLRASPVCIVAVCVCG